MLALSLFFAAIAMIAGVLGLGDSGLMPPTAAVGMFGLAAILFLATLTNALFSADLDDRSSRR